MNNVLPISCLMLLETSQQHFIKSREKPRNNNKTRIKQEVNFPEVVNLVLDSLAHYPMLVFFIYVLCIKFNKNS